MMERWTVHYIKLLNFPLQLAKTILYLKGWLEWPHFKQFFLDSVFHSRIHHISTSEEDILDKLFLLIFRISIKKKETKTNPIIKTFKALFCLTIDTVICQCTSNSLVPFPLKYFTYGTYLYKLNHPPWPRFFRCLCEAHVIIAKNSGS